MNDFVEPSIKRNIVLTTPRQFFRISPLFFFLIYDISSLLSKFLRKAKNKWKYSVGHSWVSISDILILTGKDSSTSISATVRLAVIYSDVDLPHAIFMRPCKLSASRGTFHTFRSCNIHFSFIPQTKTNQTPTLPIFVFWKLRSRDLALSVCAASERLKSRS